MASASRGVWGIDIGGNCLKALRLRRSEEGFEVTAFDYIEHSKILSGEDVKDEEKEEIIAETLGKFLSRNNIGKDEVAISVAGQNSFSRFIKLPPVESKRIPEIIQFEAVQQIPFDINEVEWDWQLMDNPNTPDTEVGIFAIKNEVINVVMDHFSRDNVGVYCVQTAPMALYNYAVYDRKDIGLANEKPVVIIDMGAENTTLVVCTKSTVWQRSIRMGGNAFTEAIEDAFNLSFQKAEKLKRTAPMSKYIRQIFTAMKPIFTDFSSEIQRSLGFYASGSGGAKGFSKVIALGGGMKLQGLAKYLQQTLSVPVVKPSSFEKIKVSDGVSSAKFHENVSDFAVVYGLAIQQLGEAKIKTNLLPRRIARAMAWTRKANYFTIAACVLLAVSIAGFIFARYHRGKYDANITSRREITNIISAAKKADTDLKEQQARESILENKIEKEMEFLRYREAIPLLYQTIISCLPNAENNGAQAELYKAFDSSDVSTIMSFVRNERKQLFVTAISIDYVDSLAKADFGSLLRKSKAGKSDGDIDTEMMLPDMGVPGGAYQPIRKVDEREEQEKDSDQDDAKDGPGFAAIIEGYSPYKNIESLLDPAGVTHDIEKWGLITRFEYLSRILPETKFKLFEKGNISHFRLETGEVEYKNRNMPSGIGLARKIERVPKQQVEDDEMGGRGMSNFDSSDYVKTEEVLIDPLTKEELSKTIDLVTQQDIDSDPSLSERTIGKMKYTAFGEPKHITRDHWFKISVKFLWKDAPAKSQGSVRGR